MTDEKPLLHYEDDDDDSTQISMEGYESLLDPKEMFTYFDLAAGLHSLPYSKLKEQLLPFDDPMLKRLIPGCDVRVTITDAYYKDRKSW
ncbi:hypothetical protein NPIL_390321 [Nephila pilipes]|uniref:Uncharacterized protein n=1 Tax=Nephila pilipes TaxID=299642 RepID=A0A8X6TIS8_NEPPI|nr:hypothetical protein NPIL_390321 [Nephila pilipes]